MTISLCNNTNSVHWSPIYSVNQVRACAFYVWLYLFCALSQSINQSISQSRERERDFCPNPCTVQKCNAVRAVFLKTSLVVFVSLPFHSPCLALPHPMFTWDARNTNCLALPCPALLCLIIGNTTPLDVCSFPSLPFVCSLFQLQLSIVPSPFFVSFFLPPSTLPPPQLQLPHRIHSFQLTSKVSPHLLPTTAHCIRSACAM
ncbi:hypothetical protein BKA61DRAFT_149500 [Leptodontidium sp. MPI-SDFR-AT-0119]|nr:hypothetical protein BKA61DRAFT_149500 [Leptodontidium sp. MPI-SDFR-AT-0119]